MRLLALIGVALVAAGATAVSDPNDVAGKLDLKSAKAVAKGQLLRLTIGTWDPWSSKVLVGLGSLAGRNRLIVLYDVNGDHVADYTGRIVYRNGRLSLWITGRGNQYEPVPVSRPSRTAVTYTHPVDVLFTKPSQTRLNIAVTSTYAGARDRMPDAPGWMAVTFPPRR